MKKNIISFIFSFLLSSMLYSCASDDIFSTQNSDVAHFSFNISVPNSEIRTRGYSDGSLISEIICYVYQVGTETPIYTLPIQIKEDNNKKGGSLEIDLPSESTFNFVFLATACKQNDPESKIYFNPNDQILSVNYEKFSGNDEEVDCFFGVLRDISINKGTNHKITLKRPFAQLNIGTKDLEDYNEMSNSPLRSVSVSVNRVYSSINVLNGTLGEPLTVNFPSCNLPEGQSFPVSGNKYLSMDYLLVNERKEINVTFTATNADGTSFTSVFRKIPVQRNYQTNIFGNLLTSPNDFKVEINPEYDSSVNKDADDPWAEYDLVLKILDNSKDKSRYQLLMSLNGKKDSKTIDLKNYADSKNIIKLKYTDLGVDNPTDIRFYTSSYSAVSCLEYVLKLDINGLRDLSHIFADNTNLKKIYDIDKWNTEYIENMASMFNGCRSLTELDVSNFDTSNVTNMCYMFSGCSNLTELDLSNFDTSNVTNMREMFYECRKLNTLDLSNFNTSNVADMSQMFYHCSNLTRLNVSNFDTSNVTDMYRMFMYSWNLTKLDVSNFDTSNVKDMGEMFYECSNLTRLDVSNFNTSNVINMDEMFFDCSNLTTLDVSNFDTSNVYNMEGMFHGCSGLKSLDVSKFCTKNLNSVKNLFLGCLRISELDVSNFDTSNVTNMSSLFGNCEGLTELDLSNFETSKVTDMSQMFYHCSNLTRLNVSNFDTSNVTNMSGLFIGCRGLTELDLSNFETSKVTDMSSLFGNCEGLTELDLSNFETSKVTDMSGLFIGCRGLTELDVSNFDTSNVTNMSSLFGNCEGLTELDLSNFETSKVTDMSGMFYGCSGLTRLDLSNFEMNNVKSTNLMFEGCPAEVIWE